MNFADKILEAKNKFDVLKIYLLSENINFLTIVRFFAIFGLCYFWTMLFLDYAIFGLCYFWIIFYENNI